MADDKDATDDKDAPEARTAPDDKRGTDNGSAGIVKQLRLTRTELRKINPVTSGHTATVYLNKRGSYVLGAGRLTMGEIWWNMPREVYTVEIAPREDSFVVDLPSAEEAFSYSAKVRVTWRVHDPIAAVRGKLDDPNKTVRQHVEERLREHTRQFKVEESAKAEHHINSEFGNRTIGVSTAVEIIRCSVVLDLDESTRVHIRSRTLAEREREMLDEANKTAAHAHKVQVTETTNQHELERSRVGHELAVKNDKMEFYANALRTGNHQLLALRLAGHREDVNDVIDLLMKQQNMEFDGARVVLESLLEANLINRKDVSGIMANASSRMAEHLGGANPLTGPTKQRPALSAADDAPTTRPADVVDMNEDDDDE